MVQSLPILVDLSSDLSDAASVHALGADDDNDIDDDFADCCWIVDPDTRPFGHWRASIPTFHTNLFAMLPNLPWYLHPVWLPEAAQALLVHGYQGRVARRWHIVPRGSFGLLCVVADALGRAQARYTPPPPTTPLLAAKVPHFPITQTEPRGAVTEGDVARVTATAHARILDLRHTTSTEPDKSFLAYFDLVLFDVIDARGQTLHLDMLYCEGDHDDHSGFYATVCDRTTNAVVARCSGDGGCGSTRVDWLATAIDFVPHAMHFLPRMGRDGRCLLRTKKTMRVASTAEYLASTDSRQGLYFGHAHHQLEQLLPVVAKLAANPEATRCLFPIELLPARVHLALARHLARHKTYGDMLAMDLWLKVAAFVGDLVFWDDSATPLTAIGDAHDDVH
ncbi:Aste57867_13580 [Aphanomyces stellatus]|uniref:Aste57867_13580 protein n=1 Tax=Aphanomyces stellatus TaxID=120398 RepID=A0A485KYU6_9STRA|nr:hypothetical protein As57867_013530 [Aphanomyces stellatus]VFT90418.1 Aste57867_13580 [Aphanomyces stellatus]